MNQNRIETISTIAKHILISKVSLQLFANMPRLLGRVNAADSDAWNFIRAEACINYTAMSLNPLRQTLSLDFGIFRGISSPEMVTGRNCEIQFAHKFHLTSICTQSFTRV